jgi:hypothetical protein
MSDPSIPTDESAPYVNLDRALSNAAELLDDLDPETDLAKRLIKAGRALGDYAYFVSVGRVAESALKVRGVAKRAGFVIDQAEQAPDRLGLDLIFRASEAVAAWTENKWSRPRPYRYALDGYTAANSVRRVAVLAFIADVRVELDARRAKRTVERRARA